MIVNAQKLEAVLQKPLDQSVYYFFSTEEYLVRQAARRAVESLCRESGEDATVIPGPVPDLDQVVMAAGTISFFGTRRVVELPMVQPGSFSDKDLAALGDVLASAENAVFVITTVFADDKAKSGKRAKVLLAQADKLGVAADLAAPTQSDALRMITQRAADQNTRLDPGAARALLDRCGLDLFLLNNEVDKLAAASGYTTIDSDLVSRMAARSLEADVFDMVRLVQAKKSTLAFRKLEELLLLQNDPIAISAALSGSYVDLYRAKTGMAAGRSYSQIHKDFGYRGSDWRMKKAAESASRLSAKQLRNILEILLELDQALKSSPTDKAVLLQTALARIIAAEGRV